MSKKPAKKASASKRALYTLMLVITLLGAIHLVLQYINIEVRNEEFGSFYELTNRFDFDDESSVPTWVSQFIFLLLGASAFLLAYLEKQRLKKLMWSLIGVVSMLGSLDEVAALHENILQAIHLSFFKDAESTLLANAWVIVLPFVIAAAAVFMYVAVSLFPKKTIRLFAVAATVYLTGAVCIDIIASADTMWSSFVSQGLLVAAEELLELIGLSIGLYATIDYLESKYSKKIQRATKELRR